MLFVLNTDSVTEPGCLSRILDPNLFHPGTRVEKIPGSGSASASKNFSILTPKIVSKLSEILSGMFIPDPDPGYGIMVFFTHYWFGSQIQGSKRHRITDPGSEYATYGPVFLLSRRCCSSTALLRSVWSAVYSVEPPAVAGTLLFPISYFSVYSWSNFSQSTSSVGSVFLME